MRFVSLDRIISSAASSVDLRSQRGEGEVNERNEQLLDAAAFGRYHHLKELLENGAYPKAVDGYGNNALILADRNFKCLALLLRWRADILQPNKGGINALQYHIVAGNIKCVWVMNAHICKHMAPQVSELRNDALKYVEQGFAGGNEYAPQMKSWVDRAFGVLCLH